MTPNRSRPGEVTVLTSRCLIARGCLQDVSTSVLKSHRRFKTGSGSCRAREVPFTGQSHPPPFKGTEKRRVAKKGQKQRSFIKTTKWMAISKQRTSFVPGSKKANFLTFVWAWTILIWNSINPSLLEQPSDSWSRRKKTRSLYINEPRQLRTTSQRQHRFVVTINVLFWQDWSGWLVVGRVKGTTLVLNLTGLDLVALGNLAKGVLNLKSCQNQREFRNQHLGTTWQHREPLLVNFQPHCRTKC